MFVFRSASWGVPSRALCLDFATEPRDFVVDCNDFSLLLYFSAIPLIPLQLSLLQLVLEQPQGNNIKYK